MTRSRALHLPMFVVLLLAAPLLAACGGSSDKSPTGPSGGNNQTASTVTTPSSATIARGATTTTTVVFSATGGLSINALHLQRQFPGISLEQTSSQTVGTTITKIYTIGADATVPVGVHDVRFWSTLTGYTGTGTPPATLAIFKLTVTQ